MYLKKVGPKRADLLLKEAKIRTFGDLLHYFPRKYIDRSRIYRVRELTGDLPYATLVGKVGNLKLVKGKFGPARLTADFTDGTGILELIWFKGADWVRENLKEGQEISIFGSPKFFGHRVQMAHPEIDAKDEKDSVNNLKIVPFYPGTEKLNKAGLDSRGIRTLLAALLEQGQSDLFDNLSPTLIRENQLMSRAEALVNIHFPKDFLTLEQATRRLKFEEFFFFQLMLAERKAVTQPARKSFPFETVGHYFNTFYTEHLPFELTNAQKRVLKEVRRDLGRPFQMNRLVQGDVGCGKTMVAFMTCLIARDNGYQSAIMAPTEILAEQHFSSFKKYAGPLGLRVAYLVGGQKKSERKQYLDGLKNGTFDIAVGTHALIVDSVEFKNLGLSIVDEQHKFGVMQRQALWDKGKMGPVTLDDGTEIMVRHYPHNMVMTATPIPRTLGMTVYGDLDVSVIDELPPGRSPILTAVRAEPQRLEVFGFIRKEIEKGRQVYVVYPLIEESDKLDYLAATEGFESLCRTFPRPQYQVGMVHGRMPPEEKEAEMARFKKGEIHILVSTTVIEVGVDVPNASIMVIENAEKFGLSQLHQLRGRVGRGAHQAYCILMVGNKQSEDARVRLGAMVKTQDGFKIAEIDLKLRGPGDFLGTRQSGLPEFRLANIVEDGGVLNQARAAAFKFREEGNMDDPENQLMKAYFQHYLAEQGGTGGVA